MQLLNLVATRPQDDPAIGDILICGACRVPSVITPLATRILTEEELALCPPETHDEIRFAIRALNAKLSSS